MIRPLRIHHHRIFAILGLVLPVTFVLGIAARKQAPEMLALPESLTATRAQSVKELWQRNDLFTNASIQVALQQVDGRLAVACAAPANFAKPDLLVYWVGSSAAPTDRLPVDTILLGTFGTRSFPLPDAVKQEAGRLVLFSLADQEVVAVSKPVRLNPATK